MRYVCESSRHVRIYLQMAVPLVMSLANLLCFIRRGGKVKGCSDGEDNVALTEYCLILQYIVRLMQSVSVCICNWQNVLGTHHASAHGGSSDLIVKMLD